MIKEVKQKLTKPCLDAYHQNPRPSSYCFALLLFFLEIIIFMRSFLCWVYPGRPKLLISVLNFPTRRRNYINICLQCTLFMYSYQVPDIFYKVGHIDIDHCSIWPTIMMYKESSPSFEVQKR